MFAVFLESRSAAIGMIFVLLLGVFNPVFGQTDDAVGEAKILGKIVQADGKTALVGAVVLAYNLTRDEVFRSTPTAKKGKFEMTKLPLGYYDLAIELPDGSLHVGNGVVNLPPAGKAILTITVAPYGPKDEPRQFGEPTTAATGEGVARLDKRLTQKEFWKSPKGIAIIAGIGGGLLLVWAASGAEEDPATAF